MQWEVCETRLVLSAQLLGDWLGSAQLQMHQSLETPMLGGEIASAPLIEPQTAQAHQLSGWNAMQQEFGLRGEGQTVAVIDSGVAWDHVALGKGFGSGYRVVGGWDFAENDANPYDDGPTGFHGTHVSGIIGSDDKTYSGVAPGVDLVALRVFNDAGQGQIAWVEQALSWVHTHRNSFANPITTVNLSLGTTWNADTVPSWATLEEEFRQLYEDGIVVTASAGNSFKQYNAPGLSYPAASPYVLPVASVDDNGSLSDFSQRSDRVLAAPGRNIMSTVPDHVLGRDGKINDFSTASGTSMAAPYVAGASVLVREAMEMVGIHDITSAKIINWLHDTADSVFDSLTNASYDRLNLQHAIDTLIPDDDVGDTSAQARAIDLGQKTLSGWVNHLGDVDVYRFTAGSAGQMTLDADSQWLDSLHWQLTSNGQSVAAGDLSAHSLHLQAGQTYELRFSADHEIGSFQMGLDFQADPVAPPVTPPPVNPPPVVDPPVVDPGAPPASDPPAGEAPAAAIDLGRVDYLSRDVSAGSTYHVTAMHDGIFTVQWTDPDAASGGLTVRDAGGVSHTDATWENGVLRLDLNATAGQSFDIQLPGKSGDAGNLTIVDVLQVSGKELRVHDTAGADAIKLDLSRQVDLDYGQGSGAVHYSFQTSGLSSIVIDGAINNDHLSITGSTLVDKVDLKPGMVSLENSQLHLTATGVEQVQFDSGSGAPDRVYLYDSDGDDTLTARPGSAELIGAGYRFSVQHVDRIFVHATGAGQDLAYLYDSAGDDQLSVRPQFTSLWGDGYFNSIRGFERVYVYATAGGYDTADLYDSAGDDRFSSGGEAASIVGSGFFSYTRYFEQVQAHATAGGHDVATLYGSNQETQWQRGSDFISFREANWDRNAQGFERVESYVNGLAHSVPDATPASLSSTPLSSVTPVAAASLPAELAAPAVDTLSVDVASLGAPGVDPLPRDASDSNARLGDAPQSVAIETAHADVDHEQLSQLLVDVLEIQDYLNEKLAVDELHWHTQPDAERELLDEIFSRYGL